MKPLVIYHANCADGFGAAFAAWLKLGDDAEYVPCQYGEQADTWMEKHNAEVTGRDVYILDFSFNRQTMGDFFELAERVVWLDHHKTAFEMWCGKYEKGMGHHERLINVEESWIELDDNKSGAMLAWHNFHPGTEVPMLIQHIDDYDRWQFKIDGTKELQKALWSAESWNFPQWKELLESDLTPMYKAGKAILRAHNQNVQAVVKGAAMKCSIIPAWINSADSYKAPWVWWNDPEYGDTCGANGLAANCPPHLCSDVGHELAKKSGTFGLCWSMQSNGRIKCELRSDSDFDVSAIAKAFGGGGHARAAGFFTDLETLKGWLK